MNLINVALQSLGAKIKTYSSTLDQIQSPLNLLQSTEESLWATGQGLPQFVIVSLEDMRVEYESIEQVGFMVWHDYETNPKLIELWVAQTTDQQFIYWSEFYLQQKKGIQIYQIQSLPSKYIYLKISITQTYGAYQTYLNQIFFMANQVKDIKKVKNIVIQRQTINNDPQQLQNNKKMVNNKQYEKGKSKQLDINDLQQNLNHLIQIDKRLSRSKSKSKKKPQKQKVLNKKILANRQRQAAINQQKNRQNNQKKNIKSRKNLEIKGQQVSKGSLSSLKRGGFSIYYRQQSNQTPIEQSSQNQYTSNEYYHSSSSNTNNNLHLNNARENTIKDKKGGIQNLKSNKVVSPQKRYVNDSEQFSLSNNTNNYTVMSPSLNSHTYHGNGNRVTELSISMGGDFSEERKMQRKDIKSNEQGIQKQRRKDSNSNKRLRPQQIQDDYDSNLKNTPKYQAVQMDQQQQYQQDQSNKYQHKQQSNSEQYNQNLEQQQNQQELQSQQQNQLNQENQQQQAQFQQQQQNLEEDDSSDARNYNVAILALSKHVVRLEDNMEEIQRKVEVLDMKVAHSHQAIEQKILNRIQVKVQKIIDKKLERIWSLKNVKKQEKTQNLLRKQNQSKPNQYDESRNKNQKYQDKNKENQSNKKQKNAGRAAQPSQYKKNLTRQFFKNDYQYNDREQQVNEQLKSKDKTMTKRRGNNVGGKKYDYQKIQDNNRNNNEHIDKQFNRLKTSKSFTGLGIKPNQHKFLDLEKQQTHKYNNENKQKHNKDSIIAGRKSGSSPANQQYIAQLLQRLNKKLKQREVKLYKMNKREQLKKQKSLSPERAYHIDSKSKTCNFYAKGKNDREMNKRSSNDCCLSNDYNRRTTVGDCYHENNI